MKYYVLTHLGPDNKLIINPTVFYKFKVNGVPVAHPHVRMFMWYNPVSRSWMLHEESTGSFIAEGRSREAAAKRGAAALMQTGENTFFDRLLAIGPIKAREEISFAEAIRRMAVTSARVAKMNTGTPPKLPDFIDDKPKI